MGSSALPSAVNFFSLNYPMSFTIHYALRSQQDGQYLVARLSPQKHYLLLFKTDYEALTYLHTHAPAVEQKFALESLSDNQLRGVLQRWTLAGVGLVADPLEPRLEFLTLQTPENY